MCLKWLTHATCFALYSVVTSAQAILVFRSDWNTSWNIPLSEFPSLWCLWSQCMAPWWQWDRGPMSQGPKRQCEWTKPSSQHHKTATRNIILSSTSLSLSVSLQFFTQKLDHFSFPWLPMMPLTISIQSPKPKMTSPSFPKLCTLTSPVELGRGFCSRCSGGCARACPSRTRRLATLFIRMAPSNHQKPMFQRSVLFRAHFCWIFS